jgi:type III secretory pathway component EscV
VDALQRVARDCRALLVTIQLSLFAAVVGSEAPTFLFVAVAVAAVAFVVLRATVVRGGEVESTPY